jgi:hypothetical protein
MNYAIETLKIELYRLKQALKIAEALEIEIMQNLSCTDEFKSQITELERAIKDLSPKGKQYVCRKDIVDGKSNPLFVKHKPYTSPEKNKLICENGAIVDFTDVELQEDFTEIREGLIL